MNREKTLLYLQWVGALALLVSKPGLDTFRWAWLVSAFGYVLITRFNYLHQNYVIIVTDAFLVVSSIYGFFKMSRELYPVDWVFIAVTFLVLCVQVPRQLAQPDADRTKVWLEIGATACILPAFAMLGLHIPHGWITLLGAHIFLLLLFKRIGKSQAIVWLQRISIGIAAYKIAVSFGYIEPWF